MILLDDNFASIVTGVEEGKSPKNISFPYDDVFLTKFSIVSFVRGHKTGARNSQRGKSGVEKPCCKKFVSTISPNL